jgi:hypothetical protein
MCLVSAPTAGFRYSRTRTATASTAPGGRAVIPAVNLLQNGSFGTGDFTAWVLGGNFQFTQVVSGTFYAYKGAEHGQFYAVLGPVGSDGTLSQTFATTPGAPYNVCFSLNAVGDHLSDFSAIWPTWHWTT